MDINIRCILIAVFLSCPEKTRTLKLVSLQVPEYVPLGLKASLSCIWEFGSTENLYSIKWYKDGKEFFRFVPRDIQPHKKFLLAGVSVETFDSTGSNIVLTAATLETEGRYRCEVSGERPHFLTVSGYANLVVVVLPNRSPVVTKLRSRYDFGDTIQVNCTSGPSWPATALSWYINNVPAQAQHIIPPCYTEHNNGLKTTSLALYFKINDRLYVNRRLNLKCLAIIPSVYWKSSQVSTIITWPTRLYNMSKSKLYTANDVLYTNTETITSRAITLNSFNFSIVIFLISFCYRY